MFGIRVKLDTLINYTLINKRKENEHTSSYPSLINSLLGRQMNRKFIESQNK